MADESLQVQWDTAIQSGDLATLERVGPLLYPEDGAAPAAPAPPAEVTRDPQLPAVEFGRQQRELYAEMEQTHPGSPRMKELEASLESLLKTQYGEESSMAPGITDAFTLAERVSFPEGTDEAVRDGMLSLAWAEDVPVPQIQAAIREISQARPMDSAKARQELEAEYGYRLPTVLQMADDAHATLPPALQRAIEDRDLFSSPVVIRHLVELREWRRRGRRGSP